MNNYYEICIPAETALQELLVAELAEMGYDGFEESAEQLKAYVPEEHFDEIELKNLLNKYNLNYSKSIINKQNWNQLWESNFEPVRVDDFVGIRAAFHPPYAGVAHEIVITPKMSFGTGHHATTWQVMKLMQELDFSGKRVFDFGTGTGILAILAEQLGAATVLAVDNDDWCIENTSENILVNNSKVIDIQKVESFKLSQQFDIVLANINRNILLEYSKELVAALLPGGQLLLSGLLVEDEGIIRETYSGAGLVYRKTTERNGWIALWFSRGEC